MRSSLRLFLIVLCVKTVSLTAFAGELPFFYFPNSLPAAEELLAFQQSANKEIVFVNATGVYSFNGRHTNKLFDFSREQMSGIRQALFTDRGLAVLADQGLFSIDLKKAEKEMLSQEAVDKIFYHQGQDLLYGSANGSMILFMEQGAAKSIPLNQKNIQAIVFAPEEYVIIGHKKISIYSTEWAFIESIPLSTSVIDSYYTGDRLLLLTADAIWSREKGSALKKFQSIEEARPNRVRPSSILEDKIGKIWVGTHDSGLLLYNGPEPEMLAPENNFALYGVSGIYESRDLSVWFYGPAGLVCKPFPFPEVPDISAPGIVLDGLFIHHKDAVRKVAFSGIDSISIHLQEQEQLLINAFAINYTDQNNSFLTYRIVGEDQSWRRPAGEDFILLAGLEPGNHIVELAAENEQGVKSEESIRLHVQLSRPLWSGWWTMGGASLCMMMLGFMAFSGLKSARNGKSREAKERYEKELMKLQKQSHEQMMKADGLRQVNELISSQKQELEEKNRQILAQKYELSFTNDQIKKQKDLIERTSEKLQASINYARRIQTALVGDEVLLRHELPNSFVFFKPRDQVSGDFFWFEKTQNEKGEELLIIAAVDCTGHGVPGAIVSVVGIKLLNAIVNAKKITDPGMILTELNADLLKSLKYEQTKINDGMDMSLCAINLQQQKLFFAGAKNPVYIVENGELTIIKGDKFAIGGQNLKADKKTYQTHEIALKGGGEQMFYLFTDGYQDQFGGAHKSKFLTKNFKELLVKVSGKSMMDQKYTLIKTMKDWQGDEGQTDDILVLGFRL